MHGGKFGNGFASTFVSSMVGGADFIDGNGAESVIARTFVVGTVGGTVDCDPVNCVTNFYDFVRIIENVYQGPDGLWDLFWGDDDVRPDGELGGTPFKYTPVKWEVMYPNNFRQ